MLFLSSRVQFDIDGSTAKAHLRLRTGDRISFALQYRASWEKEALFWAEDEILRRLNDTVEAWRSWSALHQNYDGPWRDLVHQSGRVLQGLTYQPTGAMVAAPTTSLPEAIGAGRNWDYRCTWMRDASFTLEALWIAACPEEANKFFDFMAFAALTQIRWGLDLQIMYGVGGEHDLSERELPHLGGWQHSRPVRIGNGAWNQRQLDVYGELLSAVRLFRSKIGALHIHTRELLAQVADLAASRWKEKDQGIWEIRGKPQHFLYSKLMCWVALDRAITLADALGASERVSRWQSVRQEIHDAIMQQGWNPHVGAFTQAFGSGELDASSLMLPIVGFLPADDPRMLSTIHAIASRLTDKSGLVYRYRTYTGRKERRVPSFFAPSGSCKVWRSQARLTEQSKAFLGRVDSPTILAS